MKWWTWILIAWNKTKRFLSYSYSSVVSCSPGIFFSSRRIISCSIPQDVHSDGQKRRRKRPETTIKRRITAWIFTVYRHNPSSRITGRFFARKRSSFFTLFIYFSGMTDYGDVFTPIFAVLHHLQPFSAAFLDLGRLYSGLSLVLLSKRKKLNG
jgi:hypothetical protein